jgi:putative membrane protein
MSARDHLAAKRTFLAWVRTSIALMGFGFVIAKFQIFLHVLAHQPLTSSSLLGGVIMIIMGIATLLYGFYEYLQDEKLLTEGRFTVNNRPMIIYTLLLTALAIGLVVSLYISAYP